MCPLPLLEEQVPLICLGQVGPPAGLSGNTGAWVARGPAQPMLNITWDMCPSSPQSDDLYLGADLTRPDFVDRQTCGQPWNQCGHLGPPRTCPSHSDIDCRSTSRTFRTEVANDVGHTSEPMWAYGAIGDVPNKPSPSKGTTLSLIFVSCCKVIYI
jgi:hypothetical protein